MTYDEGMKRANELLSEVIPKFGVNVGELFCCTTGGSLHGPLDTSVHLSGQKYLMPLNTDRIPNDPFWDRYNNTDKFEVIKL